MRRRDLLTLAGAAGLSAAFPRLSFAQQAAKVPRIAIFAVAGSFTALPDNYVKGLEDYGYVVGKNVIVDYFIAPTTADLAAYGAQALASKPDVIWGSQMPVMQRLTTTTPLVFSASPDPVANGLVSNLSHPGGNVTGASAESDDTIAKGLEILGEIIPGLSGVAAFADPTAAASYETTVKRVQAAGQSLNMEILIVDVSDGDPFPPSFARAATEGMQALFYGNFNYYSRDNDGSLLSALRVTSGFPLAVGPPYVAAPNNNEVLLNYLALLSKLPTMGQIALSADAGALLSYVANEDAVIRGSAYYVDAILKGAKPGDLPVELPTKFDLVLNMKMAKALAITISPAVQVLASRVIE